jgi:flagellin-like protein
MELKNSLDDAVSPVVGVILMVAVTVILAAVIGSFVLDLGNNVQANAQAGVTFNQDSSDGTATVQVVSMENADDLKVTVDDSNVTVGSFDNDPAQVGDTLIVGTDDDTSGSTNADGDVTDLQNRDEVTVIGVIDGKETVLQTFTYEN